MRRIKLGVLGLVSMCVLSIGLGTPIQKEDSSTKIQPVMKLYTEHGEGI
jgi:hypothetical protein